jgi:hypothetical protein
MVDPRVAFWELQLLTYPRNLSKIENVRKPNGTLTKKIFTT